MQNCSLVFMNEERTNPQNIINVNVQFPAVRAGKHGLLKFISKENFKNRYQYRFSIRVAPALFTRFVYPGIRAQ